MFSYIGVLNHCGWCIAAKLSLSELHGTKLLLKEQCHAILVELQNSKRPPCIIENRKMMLYGQSPLKCSEGIIFCLQPRMERMKIYENFRKLTTFRLSLETVSSEKHHQFNTNSHLCCKYIVYLFGGLSRMLYV